MPRNLIHYNCTEMDSDISLNGRISGFNHIPRARGYTLIPGCIVLALARCLVSNVKEGKDDDNLKHLSVEEQSALLFFEETLKSFQDDLTVNGGRTLLQLDEDVAHDSEPEDIIDLVPVAHGTSELKEVPKPDIVIPCDEKEPECPKTPLVKYRPPPHSPHQPAMDPSRGNDNIYTDNSVERHNLLGAIPTPVLIAEQISKKPTDNGNLSPTSPTVDRPIERRKNAATSPPPPFHKEYFRFPSPHNGKITHFPNNIVINKAGKEFNTTISKAHVNVLQRKAQVLANLHGENLSVDEVADRMRHSQMIGHDQSASFRDYAAQQARYEALIKLQLIKETPVQVDTPLNEVETDQATNAHKFSPSKPATNEIDNLSKVLSSVPSPFIPAGKTITIPGATSPTEKKFTRQSPLRSIPEPSQSRLQNDIRRTSSLPRPPPFRAHGVSVQFSGRGATEESRKEALRQLGLMKKSA